MKEPWSIKSRARECAGSERAFEDGEPIHAAIFPDPDSSGYLRKDFCDEAWKERDADSEVPFSHWKTIFQLPVAEEKAEAVVQDDPETLLRRLVEEEEEHTEKARYILAVMLERKKILRETDTQKLPSGILRVYEHRKTGDVFIIKDPEIALADVEMVQEEIRDLLDPQPEPEPEEEEEKAAGEAEATEPEENEAALEEEGDSSEEEASEEDAKTEEEE
ncbi:hypothetical protein N9868_03235 [Akkermansiaceae bacterium]|nr:hypothetical protein [Akkermansiaceae bacterium]MDB4302255.1 hypothetical protein [bacterium]MDB0055821.1 hypothetical protein [Akkermansiaceae bacterium]MDB4268415.1 hypothetical protein [Akkermansiaceae bacterium]MDB4304783.1 hypothetical protein [Akkermansiaceae bacterium]